AKIQVSSAVMVSQDPYPAAAKRVVEILDYICLSLAHAIIPEYKDLVLFRPYRRWLHKFTDPGPRFVDLQSFKPVTAYKERQYLAGFVGRLSEEKGVQTLLGVVEALVSRAPTERIIIAG